MDVSRTITFSFSNITFDETLAHWSISGGNVSGISITGVSAGSLTEGHATDATVTITINSQRPIGLRSLR